MLRDLILTHYVYICNYVATILHLLVASWITGVCLEHVQSFGSENSSLAELVLTDLAGYFMSDPWTFSDWLTH